ncbi:MAG: glycosyltransferase family 4 protein [Verrucomicrobia bacterium]|nr:glycosyltransferase family 4 protein [Verrucomicrobiota bacterium]
MTDHTVPPRGSAPGISPPHVIHVVISLAHGGLERLVVDWTNARNRRHPGSTSICCLDQLGDLATEVEGDALCSLAAQRSRFPYDRDAVAALCSLANTRGAQTVLHSHNLAAQQYAALVSKAHGFRHVCTQHGANVHNHSLLNRIRSRLLTRYTDVMVAVAESTAGAMQKNFGIPARSIHVIPNGIDADAVSEPFTASELRFRLGLGANSIVLGSVGRLDRVKGYDRLIEVMPDLCTDLNVVLLLVGEGPCREELERLAQDLGVVNQVVFAGFRSDAQRYLGVFDLFVLPSRNEGLSIALLEAMASGVPVLVTDVGENRRVIDEGRAGRILPAEAREWASCIRSLVGSADELKEVASRAKLRVREMYSLRSVMRSYEELYRHTEAR